MTPLADSDRNVANAMQKERDTVEGGKFTGSSASAQHSGYNRYLQISTFLVGIFRKLEFQATDQLLRNLLTEKHPLNS